MINNRIQDIEEYFRVYEQSVRTPEAFWESIAKERFYWRKGWDKVLEWDFSTPDIKWFQGAKLNITENCLDRHLRALGNKTAILFEPNNPNEGAQHITYSDLAVRVNDCNCSVVITSDGSYRGAKTFGLKAIVDEALKSCAGVECVLVAKRTRESVDMKAGRDQWLHPLLDKASDICEAETMDAEDPLFILYTSGSTGKPKGMVHTTAGYMVYVAFTFNNVFQCLPDDIYWCTADIGWITGHSYIVYGPLLNGAATLMFEGIPSYPDHGRFWEVIEKHRVTQFYTAPTAIRALAKEGLEHVTKYDLSSLKILGSVGEPINEEAWHWYNDNIGRGRCPIVDTWWQTETGGIMISPLPHITPLKPTFATLPLPGVQPVLLDENGNEIAGNSVEGRLGIKFPWPGMARTIWGDHQRYRDTYFSTYKNCYFTGDGAKRDAEGSYRITGRVDDVIIVSGHNLGTAPIEDAINEHPAVAESAIVGFPHDIKGNALYGFITLKETDKTYNPETLSKEINQCISERVGAIAKLDKMQFVPGLPKTRSGKIMRRILRKVACHEFTDLGDISTLLNPEVVQQIIDKRRAVG